MFPVYSFLRTVPMPAMQWNSLQLTVQYSFVNYKTMYINIFNHT